MRLSQMVAVAAAQSGGAAFTPADLGASLLAWWDAERADLITQSGGAVSSWRDSVGAYNATAAGGVQPVWSATGFNGRPVVTFDGVDDCLTASVPVSFPVGATPCEMWALVDQVNLAASDSTQRRVFSYGGSGATTTARAIARTVVSGVNRGFVSAPDGTAKTAINLNVDFTGRHVMRGVVTGTAINCEMDADAGSSTNTVPTTTSTRVRIGTDTATTGTLFHNGGISTILLTGLLSAPQAVQLRAYLNMRL